MNFKAKWTHSAALGECLILMLIGLLFSRVGWGQSDRGSISGSVADATGAAIPAVQISVTDMAKGVSYGETATNDSGRYQILNLPPGTYELLFKRDGFKEYDRKGITILVGQDAKLNVNLQVGSATQTVTVTADADLLDSTSATESTTITGDEMQELPLSIAGGRNALSFASMAVPTVQYTPETSSPPWISVGNSQTNSTNIIVDGIDADSTFQGGQYPPGLESVQEIQVQTSGIDAESAQTGGGSFQYELKSGTNQFHGSAFAFVTNEALDANSWADNYWIGYCAQAGAGSSAQCPTDYVQQYRRPLDRLNDWGFSAGGPIWKRHTFIFGDYERYNQNTMTWSPNGNTVPTSQMLNGDFSQLLTNPAIVQTNSACATFINAGNPCPTGYTDAGGNRIYYGSIFDPNNPGYVIPGNILHGQLSALGQKVVQIFKTDYAPLNDNLVDNYWGFSGQTNVVQNLDIKVDHYFSGKNHASASVNWAQTELTIAGNHTGGYLWEKGSLTGGPFADAQRSPFSFATIHLSDAYTLSPNLINNAILAFNWSRKQDLTPEPAGGDFAQGFNLFPEIQFGGSLGSNISTIGQNFDDYIRWQQIRFKDTLSWVRGRHIMKFGGEYIGYKVLDQYPGGATIYKFAATTGQPIALYDTPTISGSVGSSFASMMLGAAYSATQAVTQSAYGQRNSFDMFGEDQFALTKRLTANVSLRWDVNGRMHAPNGEWSNWDPTVQNPSWPGTLGAIVYESNRGQSFETDEDYHLFSPHIGFAYQVSHKLVARAGWGLFYDPIGNNTWGGTPYGSCFDCFGVSQTVPAASPVDMGFNWDSNAYPGVLTPPVKSSTGNVGGYGITYLTPDLLRLGQTQNWNAGIEYSLNKNTVVDIHYAANTGVHLHDGSLYPLIYPTWSQLYPLIMSGHAGDWISSQASAKAANVPWYPFLTTTVGGYGGYTAASAIAPEQPIDDWGGPLVAGYPHGNSSFSSLVAEIKKRAGSNLSMDMSYTFGKAEQNVNWGAGNATEGWVNASQWQDPYNFYGMRHTISPTDIRHQVKGYMTYNLPLGQNQRWLNQNHWMNYVIGGWTASGNLDYQGGSPMTAVHAVYPYAGWPETLVNVSKTPGALKNHFKKLDLANLADPSNEFFDPSAFTDQTLSTSNAAYGTLGNQSNYYSDWRGWAYYTENIALIKHWNFGPDGRLKAFLGGEFFDALNRHTWGSPSSYSINSQYFGNVTGVSGNRTGQLRARIAW